LFWRDVKMRNKFELGREYERKDSNKRLYLFLGYGTIIWSILFSIGYYFTPTKSNMYTSLFLLFFGLFFLYVGYSEKKELKKLKEKK